MWKYNISSLITDSHTVRKQSFQLHSNSCFYFPLPVCLWVGKKFVCENVICESVTVRECVLLFSEHCLSLWKQQEVKGSK